MEKSILKRDQKAANARGRGGVLFRRDGVGKGENKAVKGFWARGQIFLHADRKQRKRSLNS